MKKLLFSGTVLGLLVVIAFTQNATRAEVLTDPLQLCPPAVEQELCDEFYILRQRVMAQRSADEQVSAFLQELEHLRRLDAANAAGATAIPVELPVIAIPNAAVAPVVPDSRTEFPRTVAEVRAAHPLAELRTRAANDPPQLPIARLANKSNRELLNELERLQDLSNDARTNAASMAMLQRVQTAIRTVLCARDPEIRFGTRQEPGERVCFTAVPANPFPGEF